MLESKVSWVLLSLRVRLVHQFVNCFFFGSVEILLNGCWFVGGDDLIEALHDL